MVCVYVLLFTSCLLFVDKMTSHQYTGLLVLVLMTIAQFVPAGTKHITVTLDAKWKSTPLLLEAW